VQDNKHHTTLWFQYLKLKPLLHLIKSLEDDGRFYGAEYYPNDVPYENSATIERFQDYTTVFEAKNAMYRNIRNSLISE